MSVENIIGADDVLLLMREYSTNTNILLNTLPAAEQNFLIKNTTRVEMEEYAVNTILSERKSHYTKIIIYGKNHTDKSPIIKYRQLIRLGYNERFLYIYSGGLFEWSCLQLLDKIRKKEEEDAGASSNDLAIKERYETTCPCNDPFLYKPLSVAMHNFIS
jgi:hypothetical protein